MTLQSTLRSMPKVIFLIVTLALTAGNNVSAEVYKWIEDGTVHYGSQPPPNRAAEPVDAMTGGLPADEAEAARKALREEIQQDRQRQEQENVEQQQAEEAARIQEARRQNCDNARQALQQLESIRRLQYIKGQGELAYMTEEQRQQRMDEARKLMRENCPLQ